MGRNKPGKSLVHQVKECLDSKLAIGESKSLAKKDGSYRDRIYSWDTYRSYTKHACYFVKWCKQQPTDPSIGHTVRTLAECRTFAERWIQDSVDRGLSPYTIKLQLSALAKLYGCKTTDFDVDTPDRVRSGITRSRGDAVRDRHFREELHRNLVTFCRCTGLRRSELAQIRGEDLIERDGVYQLNITRGTKGGRVRTSPIMASPEELRTVIELCRTAGAHKIFPRVNTNADIHSYRAEYATRVYNANKRPLSDFKKERMIIFNNAVVDVYTSRNGRRDIDRHRSLYLPIKDSKGLQKMRPGYRDVPAAYYCRKDLRTVIYDRMALLAASQALGHNRECVVADHYIRA